LPDESGVLLPATFSKEVQRLISGDFESDETGPLVAAIHKHIVGGNRQIVYELVMLVLGVTAPDEIDARCLAVETITTSQVPDREALLHALIKFCLGSGVEELQFIAIGAADTLPRNLRIELRGMVEGVVRLAAERSSTQRIGALFLAHNK
jgi:hypothetical protein